MVDQNLSQQKGATFYHLTGVLHFMLEQVLKLFCLVSMSMSFERAGKARRLSETSLLFPGCDKGQDIHPALP